MPVVFAGYGITAKNSRRHPGLDYDDYAGVDVKGKAVLILRREPQQHDENSPFDGKTDSSFATFQHKAVNAFQHGAAAVILVNNLAGLAGRKIALRALLPGRPDADLEHSVPDDHPRARPTSF